MSNLNEEYKFIDKLIKEEYDPVDELEQLNDAHDLLYKVYSTSENARIVKAVKSALAELANAVEIARESDDYRTDLPVGQSAKTTEQSPEVRLKEINPGRFVRV